MSRSISLVEELVEILGNKLSRRDYSSIMGLLDQVY